MVLLDGKASAYNAYHVGDLGSIPGSERSSGDGWQPTPVLLPGKPHGQRSLVGYSPWGSKESDTTEELQFHFHLHCKRILYQLIHQGSPYIYATFI